MKYAVVYTDTYGGEANFSWVKREVLDTNTKCDRVLMKKAKRLIGITGSKGVTSSHGDDITFQPYRLGTILFITPLVEEESHAG